MATGSGKIMATDLIDSGVEEKLKGLAKAIEGLATDFTTVIEKAKSFRDTFKDDKTIKTFTELIKASKAVTQNITLQLKTQQDLNKVMESAQGIVIKNAENNRGLNKSLADLADSITRNTEASRKAREEDKKARDESKKLTEERKKQAQAERELAQAQKARSVFKRAAIEVGLTEPGTIERLRASNNLLAMQRKMITDAALATKEGAKRYKELTAQINANRDAIKKLNQAQQETVAKTKGFGAALGGLVGSVKNLMLSYLGVYQVVRLVQKIFQDTRTLDQMNYALNTVIKSTAELEQTQGYLLETSKNFGIDLLVLTERYVKFRAATLNTNLSVLETQKIFNSFSKASAVLGLKTDEVRGVFLALEQMISKGKVTTEELRRQLGERMPGAFGMMATAIGVSTKELDKMLKKGEVISEDALPKLAKQIEKTYGIESVTKVNTLAAAQGRFNTSWLEFVKSLEGAGFFTNVFEGMTDVLLNFSFVVNSVRDGINGLGNAITDVIPGFKDFIANINLRGPISHGLKGIKELMMAIGASDKESLYSTLLQSNKELQTFVSQWDEVSFDKLKELKEFAVSQAKPFAPGRAAIDFWNQYYDRRLKVFNLQEQESRRQKEFYMSSNQMLQSMSQGVGQRAAALSEAAKTATGKERDKIYTEWKNSIDYLNAIDKEITRREEKGAGVDELYSAELDNMEKLYEGFNKLQDDQTKEGYTKMNLAFGESLEEGNETYEQYLRNQLELTKGNVKQQIAVQQKLYDYLNKGKKGGGATPKGNQYTEYEQMQDAHKKALAVMVKDQQEYINTRIENEDLVAQLQYALGVNVLERERQNYAELLGLQSLTAEQRADVETKLAEKVMEIEEYRTKHLQGEIQKRQDLQNRLAIAQERNAIAEANAGETVIDEAMANKITARQVEATKEVEANKMNAKKVAEIQGQAELDILNIMKEYMFYKQNLWAEGTDEYAYWEKERAKITEAVEKQNQANIVNTAKVSEEQARKLVQFFGEQVNAGFDVIKSMTTTDMNFAEQVYKEEMEMAGDNVQKKILAEQKLYRMKRQEAKKQANIEKAQAVFNIGLSTAQAIMGIWAQVPKFDFGISATALTAIVAAMGAAQIAAILSQPLPAFEKGGIVDKSGSILVGEKGKEMAILPSGQKILTPDSPSILNMPKGTEIIPHDETQKMLANAARNNFIHETIDLSATNNYLREIRDKETVNVVGGYKYVSKNGLKGRYALGI